MKLVIDASAAMAIFLKEEGWEDLARQLGEATERCMTPVNFWESCVGIHSRIGSTGEELFHAWLKGVEIAVVPIDLSQTERAIEARKRYGGRPARLNLGDCFAYALAKEKDAALLFKGDDFRTTDVKRLD